MSLDKNIAQQYSKRGSDKGLYNSVYSRFVNEEKWKKIKMLTAKYLDKSKSILEIGAGNGSNSNEFKKFGFADRNLFLNELLPERIKIIKEHFPNLKLYEGNAINTNFDRRFDCIFQSTVFTSILNSDDRKKLADKMWELLESGGIILWYDFIYNNPKNSDVRKVSKREVKNLFPEAVRYEIHKVTLAPPIGRRVGKLYGLFNVRPLRSHILAVFQKQ